MCTLFAGMKACLTVAAVGMVITSASEANSPLMLAVGACFSFLSIGSCSDCNRQHKRPGAHCGSASHSGTACMTAWAATWVATGAAI